MLFTSNIFLYAFLPAVLIVFFALAHIKPLKRLVIPFLVVASLIFYGYKDATNVILLLVSIITNYSLALLIQKAVKHKTLWFVFGIVFNLGLLFYYKYTNFFIQNLNIFNGNPYNTMDIVLPLAISFYTFQQIAYLVDTKRGEVKEHSFQNYLLFVTFFPQLIIGPIVHHQEMMPQFFGKLFGRFSWENFKIGYLYLFAGIIKKIFLSDGCSEIVDIIHADISAGNIISFADAWSSAFAFSFQIYFDFSGYTDMAIGIAYMFGIILPFNFNSPYKSRNIGEFWRYWHMTLSRWLRDYLYIPLGGNSNGALRAAVNAVIVFFLGGLWHGAAWTFVLWGLLQGLGLFVFRLYSELKLKIPAIIGISVTFIFSTVSWVLFRSETLENANKLYLSMIGKHGLEFTTKTVVFDNVAVLTISTLLVFFIPNTHNAVPKLASMLRKVPVAALISVMILLWLALAAFDLNSSAEFIYFDF